MPGKPGFFIFRKLKKKIDNKKKNNTIKDNNGQYKIIKTFERRNLCYSTKEK